jgi:hypothetical protein
MPIRFRCAFCSQLLGIARRKSGSVINCPTCGGPLVVPREADNQPAALEPPGDEPNRLLEDCDVDILLRPPATGHALESEARVSASPEGGLATQPSGLASVASSTPTSESRVGVPHSVAPHVGLLITPGRATVLAVVLVVLLAAAFVVGFLVGQE